MPIYRGTTTLKAYKGDMQPVNVYRGSTKVAGWHSASYSGTSPLTVDCDYDVPPDALVIDGKCVQTPSCWGTNLVTNGDFSNGTTKWAAIAATIAAASNVLTAAGDGTNQRFYAFYGCNTSAHSHNWYISAYLMLPSVTGLAFVRIQLYDGSTVLVGSSQTPSAVSWQRYSEVVTTSTTSTLNGNVAIYAWWSDAASASGKLVNIKNVIAIDLTAAFGAGKEPTAAQMDVIMAQFPNSWFNGSAQLSTDTTKYTPNSPSPSFPAPITTITGNVTITGADGAASDTETVALGSAVCASLPDGTHDSYDAVTGVLTKRVGKYIGASGTSWTISDAAASASFMSDRIMAGTMSGHTVTASAACVPTIYYKLATPTTVQLTPHLPVVRTGIKTLTVGADVMPNLSATVKSMD